MRSFQYEMQPCRVVFGAGTVKEVKKELQSLGVHRALVISTPGRSGESMANLVTELAGEWCIGVYARAVQHVPLEVAGQAVKYVLEHQADGLIAVGGGSSIGLAKAVALETGLPILAIPTNYSGSEMTPVWGITGNGIKKTGKSIVVKPKMVIYDPELTVSLPLHLTVTSGINAMAHCIEGLYSEHANPVISMMAEEGIRALGGSIRNLIEKQHDLDARSDALYGAWLAGTVLGSVGMALHHKLCHTLGGSFNLPHAETHTVVLPYVISYNFSYTPEAVQAMSRALGTDESNVARYLFNLVTSSGVPTSLAGIGLKEENIAKAAAIATKNPYYNPRPVDEESIRELLNKAYSGESP